MQKIQFQVHQVIQSITAPFRGFSYLLQNPKLWGFIAAPYLINLLIGLLLFSSLSNFVGLQIDKLLVIEWFAKYHIIVTILRALTSIISFIVASYVFLAIGIVVSAPFNAIIVDHVLDNAQIHPSTAKKGIRLILWELKRALIFEFEKVTVSAFFFVATLILNFIPALGNGLFIGLNFGLQMYMHSLDLSDSAFTRCGFTFRQKTSKLLSNIGLFGPFAGISTFFLTIPFINILFIPIATVGMQILIIELLRRDIATKK